jgi:hypothetical protein
VGAVAGAGSYAALAPEPEPVVHEIIVEVPSQTPPDSPIPEPQVPDFPLPEPAEPLAEDLPAQADRSTSTRPREARRGEGPDEGSSESTEEERSLLSRAQTAIARSRGADALTALEEHGRRFPRGAFVEEREALKVQALLVGGRTSEARRAAAAFLEGHPRSIFRETVEAALGE